MFTVTVLVAVVCVVTVVLASMDVLCIVMVLMLVAVTAEHMGMAVSSAAQLLHDIVQPKQDQRAAGNPREPASDLIVKGDAKPGDKEA